jgi:hypothetical protein
VLFIIRYLTVVVIYSGLYWNCLWRALLYPWKFPPRETQRPKRLVTVQLGLQAPRKHLESPCSGRGPGGSVLSFSSVRFIQWMLHTLILFTFHCRCITLANESVIKKHSRMHAYMMHPPSPPHTHIHTHSHK